MHKEKPIKKDYVSLYWKCQLAGWGVVSVYWAYVAYFRVDYPLFATILNYILDVVLGIGITHVYREALKGSGWFRQRLGSMILKMALSILILAVSFMLIMNIKWYFFWKYAKEADVIFFNSLWVWDPVFITGLRLMSIWVLAYHLYHYYQREIRTTRENAELSLIAKQAQLDNLSAQLNPHFLFNSLNSVKSLIIEDPQKARRAVDLLSDLLRTSIYDKGQELTSIKEELLLVQDYVELEKLRFEERLHTEFHISDDVKDVKIPPLSIQLLIENAIKHGVDKSKNGGTIILSAEKKEKNIRIEVQSPGQIHNSHKTGLGLKNLQRRLKLQYKDKASFNLKDSEENKVIATLMIPTQRK
ncbi:sensor histidine kinase [Leptobacterium flavescens]|uniref:Sensor histidine kinase n=2 Tax=Leptobacterium flavescens TaxID=472055 RepID=A0A6P0UM04_9FLAO|nr:sensor histidine kinase [Leptobacterium flavescens]